MRRRRHFRPAAPRPEKVPKVARTAIRRSAEAGGGAVLSRRGGTITVAVNGRAHDGQLTALVETLPLRSAAFARYVERRWYERRDRHPEEHPIRALRLACFYADAAMRHAHRRCGRWWD